MASGVENKAITPRKTKAMGMTATGIVERIVDFLEPENLLWYGSDQYGVADYPRSKGIPVHVYPAKGRGNLDHHGGEA